MTEDKPKSSYEEFLPALLQGDPVVGQFLQAFEKVLTGSSNPQSLSFKPQRLQSPKPGDQTDAAPGLEEVIRHMHLYLTPQETPAEFLPWLAGWVALSLRDDWPELTKRTFIRQMVPLYKLRGTKLGLEEILGLYLDSLSFPKKVTVYDQFSTKPNYFQVELTLPHPDPEQYWRQARIAKGIIDQEKPAHTYYALRILTPSMRITGRMYPFSIAGIAQPVAGTNYVKTFRITVKEVVSPGASTAPTEVPLIIGLNARSSSPLHTQLQPQIFQKNQPVRFEVQAEFQSEAQGWQITLRDADGNSTVTLKLQPKEILQEDNPFYLSLNNLLDHYRVKVEVEVIPENIIGMGTIGKSPEKEVDRAVAAFSRDRTNPVNKAAIEAFFRGTISVTGEGTQFKTQLKEGDLITATYTAINPLRSKSGEVLSYKETRRVQKILRDDLLIVDSPFPSIIPAETNFTFQSPPSSTQLELQPPLRIYRLLPNSTKPNPSSGNTLIGTQTHP